MLKGLKAVLKSIYTEKPDNLSIGSICMSFIILAWIFYLIWCTIHNQLTQVAGVTTATAGLVATIYIPKKAAAILGNGNDKVEGG